MTLRDFLFPKLRIAYTWSDKCLKSTVTENPSTSNMVNVPKHCSNLNYSFFILLLITAKSTEFEKVSLFGMANLETGC